jgi:hypothetical protein
MGSIRSALGAEVTEAQITIRDARGKIVFMTVPGSDGNFGGRGFLPGIYTLEIVAEGYKPQQIKGLKINARETARLLITLTSLVEENNMIMGGISPIVTMGDVAAPTPTPKPEPVAVPGKP